MSAPAYEVEAVPFRPPSTCTPAGDLAGRAALRATIQNVEIALRDHLLRTTPPASAAAAAGDPAIVVGIHTIQAARAAGAFDVGLDAKEGMDAEWSASPAAGVHRECPGMAAPLPFG